MKFTLNKLFKGNLHKFVKWGDFEALRVRFAVANAYACVRRDG